MVLDKWTNAAGVAQTVTATVVAAVAAAQAEVAEEAAEVGLMRLNRGFTLVKL